LNYKISNTYFLDYRFDNIQGPIDIYIKNGRLTFDKISPPFKEIEAKNYLIIPSFVQLHVHLCQFLLKGIAEDIPLFDWLKNYLLPYEFSLSKEQLQLSSRMALYELIDSGTTTILDMGTFNHQEGIFEEIRKSGIRGFSGNVLMDRKIGIYANDLASYIDYTKDLIAEYNKKHQYVLCPRFLPGITKKGIKSIVKLHNEHNLFIHTHASETKEEVAFSKKIFGFGNIEAMENMRMLDDKTIIAHAIHISKKEIVLLKKRKASIAHCPSANMKLGSGIAHIDSMNNLGINIGLGSDGSPCNNNHNQLIEMRLAGLLQKVKFGASVLNAKEIFKMATINGAKALHLEHRIGSIEEGKSADILFVNMDSIHKSVFNYLPFNALIYSMDKADIKYVFSSGNILKDNGNVLNFDINGLMQKRKEFLKEFFSNRF